jgi:hypothetical protein
VRYRLSRTTVALAFGALVCASGARADDLGAGAPAGNAPAPGGSKVTAEEPATADPKVMSDLDAFCTKWMGFLATRERDNKQGIKWEKGPAGVVGKYVGYSTDYECKLKGSHGAPTKGKGAAVPVATITYREYVYQQEGSSQADAKDTAPRQTEATEVTEIFRYSGGKWVY